MSVGNPGTAVVVAENHGALRLDQTGGEGNTHGRMYTNVDSKYKARRVATAFAQWRRIPPGLPD